MNSGWIGRRRVHRFFVGSRPRCVRVRVPHAFVTGQKVKIKVKSVGQECPTHTGLTRGKLSTLSVTRLLLYADLLGAEAEVKLRRAHAHAAA